MSQSIEDALSHAPKYDGLFADRGQGKRVQYGPCYAAKRGAKLPQAREHHDDRSLGHTASANKTEVRRIAGWILLHSLEICLRLNPLVIRSTIAARKGSQTMKNPLDSIWGTIISGLVLTFVLYVFARAFLPF